MKNQRMFIFSAVLIMMTAVVSCRTGKVVADVVPVTASQVAENIALDSVEWHDSATVGNDGVTSVNYKCVFPVTGTRPFRDSVMQWVCENYGDTLHAGVADIKALLEKMGRKTIEANKAEIAEILSYREGGDGYPVGYDTDIRVWVEYENADYMTLSCQAYVYTAGAHGLTVNNSVTFSKKDGSRMGWGLLQDMSRKEITDRIKSGLAEYFKVADSEFNGNLRDMLLGVSEADYENNFPLPACPPYLTKNGVMVIYQQYEIAPYAAGMPWCVVKP